MQNLIPIQKLVAEELAKTRKEREAPTSWWPSGLGSCPTGRFLARKGLKPEPFDDRTLRVFAVGNHFEEWLATTFEARVKEEHPEAVFERQVRLLDEGLGVSGYADLRLTLAEYAWLYEFKSMHSNSFWHMTRQKESGKFQHRQQLWLGMKLTNTPLGSLVYLSKDDLTIMEYPVRLDDKELEEATIDELALMNAALKADLPPPPLPPAAWQSKYCNFHHLCVAQPAYLPVPEGHSFYKRWEPKPAVVGRRGITKGAKKAKE